MTKARARAKRNVWTKNPGGGWGKGWKKGWPQRYDANVWWSADRHFVIEQDKLGFNVVATNRLPESPSNWSTRGRRHKGLADAKAAVVELRKKTGPWSPGPGERSAERAPAPRKRTRIVDYWEGEVITDTSGSMYRVLRPYTAANDAGFEATALRGKLVKRGSIYKIPHARIAHSDDTHILIEWRAVENKREGYGWLPIIAINGSDRGNTWAANGYDKQIALALAKREAQAEAERFLGDYNVQVEKAKP